MKKVLRLLGVFFLLVFCLTSCDLIKTLPTATSAPTATPTASPVLYQVYYHGEDGSTLKECKIPLDQIDDYRLESKTVGNRTYEFCGWNLDINEAARNISAKPKYNPVLEKYETALRYADIRNGANFDYQGKNGILVVLVNFADSDPIDRTEFETMFNGEFDADNCLRSVSSYYKYASYGKDLFDFRFVYYDCSMTCEEAWHYVNDEDGSGQFVGNDFFYDIFDELHETDNFGDLDKNGDGYVDASYFVFNHKEVDGYDIYGGAAGDRNDGAEPDTDNPVLKRYIKVPYSYIKQGELTRGSAGGEYTRNLIHEAGHLFDISDFYNFYSSYETAVDCLGSFDMHCSSIGDENTFTKFSVGWLHPYVIEEDIECVTVTLRPSMLYDEAVLIPTSLGWNGTAFDEYILIDVMAPVGATGFDWPAVEREDTRKGENPENNPQGGVRILHVDARLAEQNGNTYTRVTDVSKEALAGKKVTPIFYNTNDLPAMFEEDSVYYHLAELVPSSNSDKYMVHTPTGWSNEAMFSSQDLFTTGDTFSMETCPASFYSAPKMNNGGSFDFSVHVDSYNTETHEATVTITRISK